MMQRLLFIGIFLLSIKTSVLSAQSIVYNSSKGVVTFRSDAPLELISATNIQLKGKINLTKKEFAFNVPIASFTGFNSPIQQEHFNENYMESGLYPNASFSGKIIEDIQLDQPGTYTIRAKGILNIHGVSQERIIKCELIVSRTKISIQSLFTVFLSDHHIPIPKVVHEKLASEIKITVKAEFIVL